MDWEEVVTSLDWVRKAGGADALGGMVVGWCCGAVEVEFEDDEGIVEVGAVKGVLVLECGDTRSCAKYSWPQTHTPLGSQASIPEEES